MIQICQMNRIANSSIKAILRKDESNKPSIKVQNQSIQVSEVMSRGSIA
jgi:hypothetical protein